MDLAPVFSHTFPIQFSISYTWLALFLGNGHLILSLPDGMKEGVLSEPLGRELRKAGQHKTVLPFPLSRI